LKHESTNFEVGGEQFEITSGYDCECDRRIDMNRGKDILEVEGESHQNLEIDVTGGQNSALSLSLVLSTLRVDSTRVLTVMIFDVL
jgi:hypothetical protein